MRRYDHKTRLCIIISIILTWWMAFLKPRYTPIITSRVEDARQRIPSVKVDWQPNNDHGKRYNASKIALIIEPEPIPLLVPLILHQIAVVPPDWRFLFIGSKRSVFAVGRGFGIQIQQDLGKIDLMVLPKPWLIQTDEDRARLWTDMRFYDEFLPEVEWILKYDRDSILCSNSEISLNDWLNWSWTGAARGEQGFAGYGGLSLRRVSAIKKVLGFQKRYNDSEAEDEWFGKRIMSLPGEKVADGSEGAFAVENNFMDEPMGYYARNSGRGLDKDIWKNPEMRKKIFEYCPELQMIMDMKLEKERCPGDNKQGDIVQSAKTTIAATKVEGIEDTSPMTGQIQITATEAMPT